MICEGEQYGKKVLHRGACPRARPCVWSASHLPEYYLCCNNLACYQGSLEWTLEGGRGVEAGTVWWSFVE